VRNPSQPKKLLRIPFCLFIWGLFVISRTALSQETGYWDNRFGGYPDFLYDGVYAIAVVNDDIYVGGAFSGVKKWNGSSWSSLGETNDIVQTLAVVGDDLYVGGGFTAVDTIPANYIAKLNLVTKKWSSLLSGNNNGVNGRVTAFAVHGNQLYVGGSFTKAGGVNANGITVWNDLTKTWGALGEGVTGFVRAITLFNDKVYAGGGFAAAGGMPANNIAKWDGKKWSALGDGVNNSVHGITILKSELYVNGSFTHAGDLNANYIAKWNTVTGQWSTLGNGLIGFSYGLTSNGKAIYVGGCYSWACSYIAKWNPDSSSWSSLGSGVSGQVLDILAKGKNIYVGGSFKYAGGKPSTRFAIWHEPNESPVLTPLPELAFAEDKTMYHPIRYWYPFVSDSDDGDSTLNLTVLSGKHVKATRYPVRYHFSAPANWFGKDTLQFIAADPSGLADTTNLVITVKPINDPVQLAGLPDSVSFKQGASAQLKIWDFANDVETPDSLLYYKFSSSHHELRLSFNRLTGLLTLAAPEFHGRAHLVVTAGDGRSDVRDTITVRVESPANRADLSTNVASRTESLPAAFELWPNSPNPYNPSTTIHFDLPQAARVKVAVYNLRGELVQTLVDGEISAGAHLVRFDGRGLASGVYFYRIEAGGVYTMTRKMVLQK